MASFLNEQRDAQRIFDKLNLMADRRVREAKLIGRVADTLMTRRRFKTFKRF